MPTKLSALVCALHLLVGCSDESQSPGESVAVEAAPQVTYVTTENFDEEVLQSTIPVLVDFTATWCVPCKVVDPVIMSLYPEMSGRAKVFKLDIDEDPEIYQRLGVNGVPHILFFNEGQEQDRIVSPQSREVYVQYLEALIDGRSTLEVSLQLVKEDQFRRHFILSRSLEDLREALGEYPELLSEPFENGQTPLSLILNRPNYRQDDQIEFALAHGAQPTTRDLVGLGRCDDFTAAVAEDPEAVNRPDPDGATPLYLSLARSYRLKDGDCIRTVLDAGADPRANTSQRYALIRTVVLTRDPALIGDLLDRGLDPEKVDENGWNMLHWAASYQYLDVVSLLVGRGSNLAATNDKGETAADIVRRRRDRSAKALEDGVNAYGRAVEEESRPYYQESVENAGKLLAILEQDPAAAQGLHGSTPPATGKMPALPHASAAGEAPPAEGSLHGSTPPATGKMPALPHASAAGEAPPAEGSLHGSTPPATGKMPALPHASAAGEAPPAEGS